ncbi:MAG: dihydroneopterin aldolase [Oscillospiraceae bacterium]|jgi:dihydroneopterin aldolase|nr:dihydroneopterin aldolase [Oscillospiraceae bacterium]
MDKIRIKGLEIYAYHGVLEEEKENGQPFILDVTLYLSLQRACVSDNLSQTVNYDAVCTLIEREMLREKYDLIERAAYKLCEAVLREFGEVEYIKIKLKKPYAPVSSKIKYASAEIKRGREILAL